MNEERHLTSEEVAGYLDQALSEVDSARIRVHLASCAPCRDEIRSASRLLERAPRARSRFVMPAVAAAAVLAVLLGKAVIDANSPSEQLRGNTSPAVHEGVSAFQAVAPIGRQRLGDRTVFVWRPMSPLATYRLTLTDERGERIWVQSTTDTSVALADRTALTEGLVYHWYVDALLPDGTTATTGIASFQVVR